MSLRDGSAKMSKSDTSDMSRINLDDEDDAIAQKIRKAKTDAEPLPDSFDALEGRPEAANLVTIYAALTDRTPQSVTEEFAGKGFGAFKPALAELLIETLAPIRKRLVAFKADPGEIDRILATARPGPLKWPRRPSRAPIARWDFRAESTASLVKTDRFIGRSARFCDKCQVVLYSG
jgi:tryptophanyl-tRNA synthetase